jgi:EF hand
MDINRKGKISKQEWMKFMEAEFDRLDVEKDGELDFKEIAQSRLRASYSVSLGK